MNKKQIKRYAKLAKQHRPRSKKPVNRAKLVAFKFGFEKAAENKCDIVSQRKKAIKRNPIKFA